jgi:hypothetical protein
MSEPDRDNQEQVKPAYSISFKMVPLILVYQLWVVAIIQAFGWAPALSACVVTGGWLYGIPKGFLKNVVFVFIFAIVLPLLIIAALGLEAAPVTK